MFNKEANINTDSEKKNFVGIWFYDTQHKVKWKLCYMSLYVNQTDLIIHLEAGWVSNGLIFFLFFVLLSCSFFSPQTQGTCIITQRAFGVTVLCNTAYDEFTSNKSVFCITCCPTSSLRLYWRKRERPTHTGSVGCIGVKSGVKNVTFKHMTCMWGFYGESLTWGILFRVAFVHAGWYLPVFR